MDHVSGASATPTGLSPFGPSRSVSAVPASIPCGTWNAPELARLHRELELAYRRLPDGHDDAHRLLALKEAVEDLDFDLADIPLERPVIRRVA